MLAFLFDPFQEGFSDLLSGLFGCAFHHASHEQCLILLASLPHFGECIWCDPYVIVNLVLIFSNQVDSPHEVSDLIECPHSTFELGCFLLGRVLAMNLLYQNVFVFLLYQVIIIWA